MYELSVKSDFAASHFLRHYEGKCKNLHGHTWKVEVIIQAPSLDRVGMVVDFIDVKKKLKSVLEPLDHAHLNDLDYFKDNNPTTEHLAKYIFESFAKEYRQLKVAKVIVWESDTSSITYFQ